MTALDPLIDTAPCGFLSIDESGRIRIANTTLAELVGSTREAIEGQPMDAILSPAGRIFYSTHLFPLLRLNGRADEVYVPLRAVGDRETPVLVNGAARQRDGAQVYDLVIVPMQQRNELENELITARNVAEEAASAKDRFLSIVSHELRTPLAAVRGYADLLLRDRKETLTEKQRRYLERITDAAKYQVGLIEDILEFASLEGRRRTLDRAPIELEEPLAGVESVLAVRAQEAEQRVRREPVPATGRVIADRRAVQQIVLNLGINAIKFSPPGSEVVVTSEVVGDRARIAVIDSGPGISPEDIERIFDPFVQLQAHESRYGASRGVGLGLSISVDLARAMGGAVGVESTVGQGSTFTLELPAAS